MPAVRKRKGFTLIELMVAVAIIAIISAVGLVSYNQSQRLARDSKRKQDLRSIAVALELYYQKNGSYPLTSPLPTGCSFASPVLNCFSNNSTTPWMPSLNGTYINTMPKDPLANNGNPNTGSNYGYAFTSRTDCNGATNTDGQYYMLYTRLENTADTERLAVNDRAFCPQYGSVTGMGYSGNLFVITSN